jgi:predicted PurR-regulated permease PerM
VRTEDAAEPAPASPETEAVTRLHLHMPVHVRNIALMVIAVIASLFALQWAKAVFIPLLMGVMLSYALTPAVERLQRWHLPRPAGAGLLLAAIVAGLVWATASISDDANEMIASLPEVAQKVRKSLQGPGPGSGSTIDKVQQAAAEFERAAEENTAMASAPAAAASASPNSAAAPASSSLAGSGSAHSALALPSGPAASRRVEPMSGNLPPTPRGVTRVVVEKPHLDVKDYLWSGTLGLMTFLGQATIVFFIAFFLLASGDTFRRKMVKLAGPRLSQKKITVQALDEIHDQIQRYLFVQLATSVVVGALTGLAFFALGLNHSVIWAILAGITNLIPYLGAVVVGLASAMVGVAQFESLDRGLLIGASSFAIHTLVGNLLTPWWLGRAGRMSPFAVFVGVLVFGWLWGVWGLLLGVPILMVVKSICDRIEELKPVGELLGA